MRFELEAPRELTVTECNCSICRRAGYLHLIVPKAKFRLLAGDEALASYRFNTGAANHLFCRVCGIKSFYVPRSHPDCYSVNVRCLDEGTVERMSVRPFDGRNWEAARPSLG
ncbi:MAG TPA: GFA family protein [Burkholderiales bacterium]|nr:GFA family protein [Burkholderiales bacterium]